MQERELFFRGSNGGDLVNPNDLHRRPISDVIGLAFDFNFHRDTDGKCHNSDVVNKHN